MTAPAPHHTKAAEELLGALGAPDQERAALVPIVARLLKVCDDHGRIADALEKMAEANEKLLELAKGR